MNKEIILAELDASTEKMLHVISAFTNEDFNHKPFENVWSAAQIGEHLLLSEFAAVKALTGESIATNRAPDEKLARIKWVMEDNSKRQAHELAQPSNYRTDPQESVAKLKEQRNRLKTALISSDLSQACMSFKHPGFGTLTRWEWIYFTIYHTERHLEQMKILKL